MRQLVDSPGVVVLPEEGCPFGRLTRRNAAASRSSVAAAWTQVLHLRGPPVLRCFSSAYRQRVGE